MQQMHEIPWLVIFEALSSARRAGLRQSISAPRLSHDLLRPQNADQDARNCNRRRARYYPQPYSPNKSDNNNHGKYVCIYIYMSVK